MIEIATVAIWDVSSNLGQVINYTTDIGKTDLSNYPDLEKSLEYIKDEFGLHADGEKEDKTVEVICKITELCEKVKTDLF